MIAEVVTLAGFFVAGWALAGAIFSGSLFESDIQNGAVFVNWKVTALGMVAIQIAWGTLIGNSLIVSASVGVLTAVLWLLWELFVWDRESSPEVTA